MSSLMMGLKVCCEKMRIPKSYLRRLKYWIYRFPCKFEEGIKIFVNKPIILVR